MERSQKCARGAWTRRMEGSDVNGICERCMTKGTSNQLAEGGACWDTGFGIQTHVHFRKMKGSTCFGKVGAWTHRPIL